MKKYRFIALLLAVFLAIGWLPVSASAEEADFLNPVEICFILTPDGTTVWDSRQVEFGTSYYDWYEALPEPERAGYTFDGWSTFALAYHAFDPEAPIDESGSEIIYLYGFWTEDASQTITFYVDGEFYDAITTEDGCLPQMPPNPEQENRIFKQWLTEDGEPFDGTATEDRNLYADWYDSVIAYDPNGNLEDTPFEPLQLGADMDDPTPAYPEELTLEAWIFRGWDPEVAETVEESVTYTAKWEPRPQKTFTLTYKANTDDPVSGLPEPNPEVFTTYDLDMETYLFPVAPVLMRTGFLFAHWNSEPDGSGKIVSAGDLYPVEKDGILYAVWERETCQVTFEGFPAQTCFWGDALPEAAFPSPQMLGLDEKGCVEREGRRYRLAGWNTAKDGTGKAFDASIPVKGNLTVYPRWIEQIPITFQVKNGTWMGTNSDCLIITLDKGTPLQDHIPTAVPQEGCQAKGSWDEDPTIADDAKTYTFTCDPKTKYLLTLQGENIIETREITEGDPIGPLPTLENREQNGNVYRFGGWYSGRDGHGEAMDETSRITSNLTIYPHWIRQVEITFQIKNGLWKGLECDSHSLTLDEGTALDAYLPTAVPGEGFKAVGSWNVQPTVAKETQTYVFTCDPKETYILTLQDENIIETREITEGEPVGPLPTLDNIERNGKVYRFGGWKTDGGMDFDENTPMTASLTVRPHWIEQIEITFQIDGGIWEESGSSIYSVLLDHGASLAGSIPTAIPGEAFKNSGSWAADPAWASAYEPLTYVYTCDERLKYTITLKDGEESTTMEVMEGYPIGDLPVLSKPNWCFTGWYAGDLVVTAELLPEGNMELEAGWEKIRSLTFDANGGANPPAAMEGPGPHAIPTDRPTRYGYTFQGWSTARDGKLPQFKTDDLYTPVGEDVLYAVWEPEKYTVTYNDGVRTSVIFENMVFTVRYGDPTPEFNGRPTRKGYSFKGWSPRVSDTVTGTVIYEAQWAKVDKTNPKTGDGGMLLFWAGTMCLSAVGLAAILKKKQQI